MARLSTMGRPAACKSQRRFGVIFAVGWALVELLPASGARAACTPTSPVNNASVTCSGTTTNQNLSDGYGTVADTGNTITVVPGASVTGTDNGVTFDTGTVLNSGTITGQGGFPSAGINGNNLVNVTNSGSISGGFFGIESHGTTNVANSGSIVGGEIGVHGSTTNVTNSGTISGGTYGVASATTNVTNSGTISGGDQGIDADNATVTNSGSISGGNFGIWVGTANVTNSGTISGNTGISALFTGNVTNSGTIIGTGGTAIQFAGNADTLTLLPGSTIIGAINLGGGGDTVNFRGGNHNLTFDTLAGAIITGTTPFAVFGNQAVAVDPTPFSVAGTSLTDFTRSVSSLVPTFDDQTTVIGGQLPTAFAAPDAASVVEEAFASIPGLSAYASDAMVFKSPTVIHADGTAIWARGFVGERIQQADSALFHNTSRYFGGAFGGDRQVRPDLRIGAFIGAGSTRSTIDFNSGNTDSDLAFAGAYARYTWGASFLKAAVQGGISRNDTSRNINNNLAPGGLETATASYDGWYVSPELTLGHRIALGYALGAQHTLTPSVQVRYLYGSLDGYIETGSTANLTMGTRTVENLEERAELKLTRTTVLSPASALLIHLMGGALGVQRVGGTTVDAALLGQPIPFAIPGKDDVWGGFGGAGFEFRNGRVAVFASGEYLGLSDASSIVSGKGGFRVAF